MDPTTAAAFGLDPSGYSEGTGTGTQGHTTLLSGGPMDAFSSVWRWLNEPLAGSMSPVALSLLVGVILVALILWNIVLMHIRLAAETL
jgi:hypothetical protein